MRKLASVALVLALLALAVFLLTPATLVNSATIPALPDDLDRYLADREHAAGAAFPLIRDTEKRIRWKIVGKKTDFAIVYLHGFSATRREIAPTAERVADALEANLFETRLRGHGRIRGAMADVAAEDWLEDAAEALAIGARIGNRVIVIGASTGATLALAMADHAAVQQVETLVLMSPNFAPADPASRWLTGPGGPLIARLMLGETRSWQPHNDQQARFWSTRYPTQTIVEVMRLVDFTNAQLPLSLEQSVLILTSPNDTVISTATMADALDRIEAPRKKVLEFEQVGDPSNHVLAGDILSPDTTDDVVAAIVSFVCGDD